MNEYSCETCGSAIRWHETPIAGTDGQVAYRIDVACSSETCARASSHVYRYREQMPIQFRSNNMTYKPTEKRCRCGTLWAETQLTMRKHTYMEKVAGEERWTTHRLDVCTNCERRGMCPFNRFGLHPAITSWEADEFDVSQIKVGPVPTGTRIGYCMECQEPQIYLPTGEWVTLNWTMVAWAWEQQSA